MSEDDEAFPGHRSVSESLAAALPACPWLDASRCIDAEASKSGWTERINCILPTRGDTAARDTEVKQTGFDPGPRKGVTLEAPMQ